MKRAVSLHIERLVLDGLDVAAGEQHWLQAAVETELARLLTEGSGADRLGSPAAIPRIAGPTLRLDRGSAPARLGEQIAGAVYKGIGT